MNRHLLVEPSRLPAGGVPRRVFARSRRRARRRRRRGPSAAARRIRFWKRARAPPPTPTSSPSSPRARGPIGATTRARRGPRARPDRNLIARHLARHPVGRHPVGGRPRPPRRLAASRSLVVIFAGKIPFERTSHSVLGRMAMPHVGAFAPGGFTNPPAAGFAASAKSRDGLRHRATRTTTSGAWRCAAGGGRVASRARPRVPRGRRR